MQNVVRNSPFHLQNKIARSTVTTSFDCKETTPTVMHSGHRYKASGPLTKNYIAPSQSEWSKLSSALLYILKQHFTSLDN
jgi:hypothetical protein